MIVWGIISRLSGKPILLRGISVTDAAALITLLAFYPTLKSIGTTSTLHIYANETLVCVSSLELCGELMYGYLRSQYSSLKLDMILQSNRELDVSFHIIEALVKYAQETPLLLVPRVQFINQSLVIPEEIVHVNIYRSKSLVNTTRSIPGIDTSVLNFVSHYVSGHNQGESWTPYAYEVLAKGFMYLYLKRMNENWLCSILASRSNDFEKCSVFAKQIQNTLDMTSDTTRDSFPVRVKYVWKVGSRLHECPSEGVYLNDEESSMIVTDVNTAYEVLESKKIFLLKRKGFVVAGVRNRFKGCICVLDGSVTHTSSILIVRRLLEEYIMQ